MRVYVYKNYNDGYAYGEEEIRVFANKEEAETTLKTDVEHKYKLEWDDIPKVVGLNETDTFERDYVSIGNGAGDTSFWIIEEREVKTDDQFMQAVRMLWEDFGEVPIDNNDRILENWGMFLKGTDRFEIWSWFEMQFNISIAIDLMGLPESEV